MGTTSVLGRRRRLGPWALTVAATAVSTYALDGVATAAGVLLVASGLLGGLGQWQALVLVAASYVAWGAGLRMSLGANWSLLERTGVSSNALSKAAYDLIRLRTASVRARRLAASSGYVATELAKEVPYYAGAFGLAAVSDSVSSNDALVFLVGSGFAAAAYEYGLARLTRSLLQRPRACASFDTDWVPSEYLTDYYSEVEPDERATIAYFVEAMRHTEPGRPVLLFGVGPTLHHVFLAANGASEIHLADYLPANLTEIARWIDRDPGAHDWRPFVRYTLECEGHSHGHQRLLRRLGDGRAGHLAQLHGAHLRARPARRRVHHQRPAPLPLLRRRRQALPERERRRARPLRGAAAELRGRIDRRARAGRARSAGLLEHRARVAAAADGAHAANLPAGPGALTHDKHTSPQEGGSTMSRITLRSSVATLAVTAGLLAAAGPAGAHGGGADFTRSADKPSAVEIFDYEGVALRGFILMADNGGQFFAAGPQDPPAVSAAGSSPRPDTSSLR